ncbi:MAG: hypothetical protein RL385_5995 [Pseudomonadota bacterium]
MTARRPSSFALLLALSCTACGDETDPGSAADGAPQAAPDGAPQAAPDGAAQAAPDAGNPTDAAVAPDSGPAAACAPFVMPSDCVIPENSALPASLACTGLYADMAAQMPACEVMAYTPGLTLYSDGADKHRWVRIPAGKSIDTTDPNELVFPVGTQLWKEFRIGTDKRRAETRLMQKTARGWVYTSYVWSEDGKTATQQNEGVKNLFGMGHDVPTRDQCNECHVGRRDFILGWDGFSLGSGALGLDAASLEQRGLLSAKLPTFALPGNTVEQQALGYLHMNCGVSCHNPNPKCKGFETGLMLRLEPGQLAGPSPAETTGVDRKPTTNAKMGGLTIPADGFVDIARGDVSRSLLVARMKVRGVDAQMPRIGTNVVDTAGVAAVEAWITGLKR